VVRERVGSRGGGMKWRVSLALKTGPLLRALPYADRRIGLRHLTYVVARFVQA